MLKRRLAASYFPYKLREKQEELISFIKQEVAAGKNVVICAPTGFGKTPAILAGLLPKALKEKRKILWAVRTGNETDRPVEELKQINRAVGLELFGLSYRGKKDMCLLLRDLKLSEELDFEDASFLCKLKEKECKYSLGYQNYELEPELIQKPRLYSEILRYCENHGICAYKLQSDLILYADLAALNYNYIIDEAISWAMHRKVNYGRSLLVVDEAHNLQAACANLNSNEITLGTVKQALKEIAQFNSRKVEIFLEKMQAHLQGIHRSMEHEEREFNVKECIEKCSSGYEDFEISIKLVKKFGTLVRKEKLALDKAPRSSLFRLGSFFGGVLENLNVDGIAFLATKEKQNLKIEMWDMRSSAVLKPRWRNFHSIVFCSGTLKPIEAFAETIGLENYSGRSFPSFFNKQNALSLIVKDLSAEGEELSKQMALKYLQAIDEFLKALDANIAIFSASYRIQKSLLKAGLKSIIKQNNRRLFLEEKGISGCEGRRILDGFKSSKNGVLCATMTGRYAEGADFPGRELEGIFLVGIPFDKVTIRTQLYIDYYQRLYGKERGSLYAYILPAMRRASQALGRALRSREDRAIFILGDSRYISKRFIAFLPDFVKWNCKSVEIGEIGREIKKFWQP
ncbi:MAG: ATP-dependent DNA helicase [Methanocellales archaeon]